MRNRQATPQRNHPRRRARAEQAEVPTSGSGADSKPTHGRGVERSAGQIPGGARVRQIDFLHRASRVRRRTLFDHIACAALAASADSGHAELELDVVEAHAGVRMTSDLAIGNSVADTNDHGRVVETLRAVVCAKQTVDASQYKCESIAFAIALSFRGCYGFGADASARPDWLVRLSTNSSAMLFSQRAARCLIAVRTSGPPFGLIPEQGPVRDGVRALNEAVATGPVDQGVVAPERHGVA